MAAAAVTQQNIGAINAQARANILALGVPRLQLINSVSVTPSAAGVPVVQAVNNVGLIRGFLIEVKGTLHNSDGALGATRTGFGASNALSNITFTDFNNIQRINTPGYHITMLNAAKQGRPFGAAFAPNVPVGFGNNWTVQSAPATIAFGADGALVYMYYIPFAYAKNDLRGAVFAGLTNATAYLSLTINPNPFAATGDALNAIYSGAPGVWKAGTQVTINYYQDYIDQLPTNQNGQVVLPPLDMSTVYDLKFTVTGQASSANTELNVPYANLRTFLSTMLVVDNGGTFNVGSDINYFALVAANANQYWKITPEVAALLARNIFMCDPPAGTYWFDQRDRPINTGQYGNTGLVINPSVVNSGYQLIFGYEQFDLTNTIALASSLPSGA